MPAKLQQALLHLSRLYSWDFDVSLQKPSKHLNQVINHIA